MSNLDISLIILSAGDSSRFKSQTKKQWLRVGNEPLWLKVTNRISSHYNFKKIIVTANSEELFYMKRFCDYEIVEGGNTRQSSLYNALLQVDTKYVLVSDVARANISQNVVLELVNNIENYDNITPYLDVCDTTLLGEEVIDRNCVKLIQTPQLSLTDSLKKAIEKEIEFTDDSSAIKSNGGKVKYIKGDNLSKKITFVENCKDILKDFEKPSLNNFTGFGYDVHAYEKNRTMYLGGIEVDSNIGFKAHSDGDVVIHSLIDALLGAVGAGDIGEWFPDTSQKYKNASSIELLKKVDRFIKNVGFEVVNVDISIVAEFPKISPFKDKISKKISQILGVLPVNVNIKATTSEKMGFIGREEGVAVYTIATLKYFDWTKL